MPRRTISWVSRREISSPASAMRPCFGRAMPMIERSVVVLPAPFRPMSVTTSPAPTEIETPCRMCASP